MIKLKYNVQTNCARKYIFSSIRLCKNSNYAIFRNNLIKFAGKGEVNFLSSLSPAL